MTTPLILVVSAKLVLHVCLVSPKAFSILTKLQVLYSEPRSSSQKYVGFAGWGAKSTLKLASLALLEKWGERLHAWEWGYISSPQRAQCLASFPRHQQLGGGHDPRLPVVLHALACSLIPKSPPHLGTRPMHKRVQVMSSPDLKPPSLFHKEKSDLVLPSPCSHVFTVIPSS